PPWSARSGGRAVCAGRPCRRWPPPPRPGPPPFPGRRSASTRVGRALLASSRPPQCVRRTNLPIVSEFPRRGLPYGRGTSGGRHPTATARVPMAAPHELGPAVFDAFPVPLAAAHPAPTARPAWAFVLGSTITGSTWANPQLSAPAVFEALPVPL